MYCDVNINDIFEFNNNIYSKVRGLHWLDLTGDFLPMANIGEYSRVNFTMKAFNFKKDSFFVTTNVADTDSTSLFGSTSTEFNNKLVSKATSQNRKTLIPAIPVRGKPRQEQTRETVPQFPRAGIAIWTACSLNKL